MYYIVFVRLGPFNLWKGVEGEQEEDGGRRGKRGQKDKEGKMKWWKKGQRNIKKGGGYMYMYLKVQYNTVVLTCT